eukprot:m.337847 g.337847  ORF g.337847 m.337847 type:complete len:428 (-) comp18245_c0_seq1:169-1452(-)
MASIKAILSGRGYNGLQIRNFRTYLSHPFSKLKRGGRSEYFRNKACFSHSHTKLVTASAVVNKYDKFWEWLPAFAAGGVMLATWTVSDFSKKVHSETAVALHESPHPYRRPAHANSPISAGEIILPAVLAGKWELEPYRELIVFRDLSDYGELRPLRNARTEKSILLIADLDHTLHGRPDALSRFKFFWETKYQRNGSVLIYNTARPLSSPTGSGYVQLIQHQLAHDHPCVLPVPDALIIGEGTEIYYFDEDFNPHLDKEWDNMMSKDWDENLVQETMEKYDEQIWLTAAAISADDKYRFAITVKDESTASKLIKDMQKTLSPEKYKLEAIPMTWANGFIVTAAPVAAGKGAAAMHAAMRFKFNEKDTLWVGDSDNDISMIQTPFKGIAMGNATPGLKNAVGHHEHIFQASAEYADGVLEGLAYFGH